MNNEEWMKSMTEMGGSKHKADREYESSEDEEEDQRLPMEKQVLSCPGCFTEVCGECQPH